MQPLGHHVTFPTRGSLIHKSHPFSPQILVCAFRVWGQCARCGKFRSDPDRSWASVSPAALRRLGSLLLQRHSPVKPGSVGGEAETNRRNSRVRLSLKHVERTRSWQGRETGKWEARAQFLEEDPPTQRSGIMCSEARRWELGELRLKPKAA